MIMPAGRQKLLLPVNPRFIALSLILAMFANMLMGLLRWPALPDMLAVVLLFWTVHQPRRVGMVLALLLGLLMDVHESALLGQNALGYVVLTYLGQLMQRRMHWFPLSEQALQVLPLFIVTAVVEVLSRLLTGEAWPHWSLVLSPLLQSLLWPVVGILLLAPQRRAYAPDKIRPL